MDRAARRTAAGVRALARPLGAGRIAALPVIVIMLVASSLVGASFANVAVLVCSVVIVAIGTGPLSIWDPGVQSVRRRAPGSA